MHRLTSYFPIQKILESTLKYGLFQAKEFGHSQVNKAMKITILPALQDNYMYLLVDEKSKQCAVVDPVEPEKVLNEVEKLGYCLESVLTTHHHWDHAGGNERLNTLCPHLQFYGADDRIKPESLIKVKHGDVIKVGNLDVECLFTPCHTSGHICYYVTDDNSDPAVFTGDTLFTSGCGKFFEGTKEQMYHALVNVLQKLPSHTRVYCGHEYTVSNLKFAKHVEPDNENITAMQLKAQKLREDGLPTIPTTIAEEMLYNPFMRVCEPAVQRHAGQTDPVEVMGCLRGEKDEFKPNL